MTRRRAPRRAYDRSGVLALEPQAFFELFFAEPEAIENAVIGDVEVVAIRGPLDQHADGWCDSYEAIADRVRLACEGPRTAIVLRIDSPGGEAAGVFEASRSLRAMAQAAGKALIAFVDGRAHSAGYALACAAERIVVSDTATVGSIGVINTRPDLTAMDAARGVRYAVVASGARKTDGHPHVAVSEGELTATQTIVDSVAAVFFDLVGELRGMGADAARATEAGVFHGPAALAAGLVDEIGTFDGLIAALAAGAGGNMPTKMKAGEYQDARAALEKIAKGDGDEAKRAQRALAAMDEDDKPADGDKPKEGTDGDKPKEGAEGEGDKPKDDDDKDGDKPAAVSASTAAALAAHGNTLEARVAALETQGEAKDRSTLLASRPDLGPELVKVLSTKPVAEVRSIVAAIPKPSIPNPAAAASSQGTRGESQGAPSPSVQASELDLRMGLVPHVLGVKREGNVVRFGVVQAAPPAPAPAKV